VPAAITLFFRFVRDGEWPVVLTLAAAGSQQRSFSTQPLLRGEMPFTSNLDTGLAIGHFIGGGYNTALGRGDVAAVKLVTLAQQVMIISAEGIVIQTPVREKDPKQGITILGRSTQGVRLMRLEPADRVVAIACFEKETR
jgi:hypothetical protein